MSNTRRITQITSLSRDAVIAVLSGTHPVDVLHDSIESRLRNALGDFKFSSEVDTERLVMVYLRHLREKGDPLGLMLCEVDHMIEALYSTITIMEVGPQSFSKHRDAIGLGTLWHDIYAVTIKSEVPIGEPLSLSDYLVRNWGHEKEKHANLPLIKELAEETIGRGELYDLVVAAVDFSSGSHKMSSSEWASTQWVHPLRIADNLATQRTSGDRHKYLVYNWACDIAQGFDNQEKVAQRILKRESFCKRLARGEILSLVAEQVFERKGINLIEDFPGLLERIETAGGFKPVLLNPITAYTTAMQVKYNEELNRLFPSFAAVGYNRASYTLAMQGA